jgi:hypothetical protein
MFCEASTKERRVRLILCYNLGPGPSHTRVRRFPVWEKRGCDGGGSERKLNDILPDHLLTPEIRGKPLQRVIRCTRLLVVHHLFLHGVTVTVTLSPRPRVFCGFGNGKRETVPPAGT